MNLAQFQRQIEAATAQAVILGIAYDLLAVLIACVCLYYVIRAAIRDGISESGLVEATRHRATALPPERNAPNPSPDMRADR